VHCESYYTDLQLIQGKCPECKRETEVLSEESYFFKLSSYQKQIIEHIEKNPDFIFPESRRNEILNRLKSDDLHDLSVSRSTFEWGIPFPGDEKHIIYVWFDALINYLSAIKYPGELYKEFWPANSHVIGKDIAWFHCVIWPAMLLSMKIKLPKNIFVHGFLNDAHGEKMSKSKGNVIDPLDMIELYGADAIRYYLMRTVPSGADGNVSEDNLVAKYNNELGNDLGNLVKRIQVLSVKYFKGKINNEDFKDEISCIKALKEADKYMKGWDYFKALDTIWTSLRTINAYMNKKEPWKNEEGRKGVLYNVLENLRIITSLLYPFIPESCEKIAKGLSFSIKQFPELKFGEQDFSVKEGEIIFPKIELERVEEFPLNIKVAKILEVQRIPDADKLYIEKIDLGTEQRQIVSGLVPYYEPEELVGKHVLVITNLKKAKLRGVESEGMLLAADIGESVKVVEAPNLSPGAPIFIAGIKSSEKEITFEQFQKVKLEIKDKKLLADGKPMTSDKGDIEMDAPDGSQVR